MKRKLSTMILTGFLVAGLAAGGCGAGSKGSDSSQDSNSGGSAYESYDMAMDDAAAADTSDTAMQEAKPEDMGMSEMNTSDAGMTDMNAAEGAGDGTLNAASAGTAKKQNQKLIYTYHYSVETKDFDAFYKKINEKTAQIGGYVESSEMNGSAADGTDRYASLTLRIPADQMEQMLTLLDSDSNITYQNCSSEDVTLQYVDMESHLKALRTEQETLLKLMEKADKLKDVIALQSQLTDIRYEIESYESQLRTYDNLVDYSTLYLNISEVQRTTNLTSSKTSFIEEIGNAFSDNAYALGQWIRSAVVWLIGSLPILIPLAAAGIAAFIFIRKKAKRRNRTMADQGTEENM